MALFEDGPALINNPARTAQIFRAMGVSTVRVNLAWSVVAPSPNSRTRPNFNATDQNGYNWGHYDTILNTLRQYGLGVDLLVGGGAPLWAAAPNPPAASGQFGSFANSWFPNAAEYGQFVQAAAKRYSWVRVWELWDEPNWGPALSRRSSVSSKTPRGRR
jgi:beta-glucosidase/6-phospho-beta-glucosidase/beta-galactosidase